MDGFRCDAGYKVPLAAWQYITARVRQEFPETIFLLEGLGGGWDVTEQLLTEGGTGRNLLGIIPELFRSGGGPLSGPQPEEKPGTGASWSTTAKRTTMNGWHNAGVSGRCSATGGKALASVSGGFGFTCGVEWLAPEAVNVHSSRGLGLGKSGQSGGGTWPVEPAAGRASLFL